MLDNETKRRIDTARDILVGKIPDPKSQVEQITIALIYKFMDDMDKESVEFGGTATFFTGDYQKYSWTSLLDTKLGGQEVLALYGEAIVKLNQNPTLPQLFRDIFKNAYLPYRDAETLKLFLKTINGFTYDHSERLGDAGQFRTPRHIIDFMVAAVQPKKDETICDPACGTAGFLISSYKYILKENTSKQTGDLLIPADRKKLMQNFTGYDISPDMVRLSLVNMYLHHFTLPQVHEYDTLTSEDRWGDTFDIILANPPFMSPKGGIKPHKKFSMQANRSEVLFADYIAEHINPVTGRAGVIVPEGIIFQSATAYKALRKLLVEKQFLYAVISLPAGVFQPYSGVKTSVLLMDKTVAKKSNEILFVKIDNDGFDLGAQRRANTKTELPHALNAVLAYKDAVLSDKLFVNSDSNVLVVSKEQIKGVGDYNLSGERYRINNSVNNKWEEVELGKVVDIYNGSTPLRSNIDFWENGTINWFTIDDIREQGRIIKSTKQKITQTGFNNSSVKLIPKQSILLCCTASVGEYAFTEIELTTNQQFNALVIKDEFKSIFLPKSLSVLSSTFKKELERLSGKTSFNFVSVGTLKTISIPLPPLSIQQAIVAKIEGYQRIIDGARQVVENYKPQIDIDESWDMVALGEVCKVINGRAYKEELLENGKYAVLRVGNFFSNRSWYYSDLELEEEKYCVNDDLLYAWSASFGPRIWKGEKAIYHYHIWKLMPDETRISKLYLYQILIKDTDDIKQEGGRGIAMMHITKAGMELRKIPLPPLSIQQQIVQGIEKEQQLVNANKELIIMYEQKIKEEIAKLWVEDKEEKVYEMKEEALSVVAEVSDIL